MANPKTPSRERTSGPRSLSDQLLDQIQASGLTPYALGKLSGVDQCAIGRWIRGDRGITLETADRLAEGLGGLRLSSSGRGRARPAPTPAQKNAPTRSDRDRGGDDF